MIGWRTDKVKEDYGEMEGMITPLAGWETPR